MSEKRDAETYVNKLVYLLKAGLNEKINEINAKKNDGITLKPLDEKAYYYLTFGQSIPAYDPCVIFGVDVDIDGEIGALSSETLRIAIELVISEGAEADSLKVMNTLQRYRRALMELMIENQRIFPSMTLEKLSDVAFTLDSGMYYALGIGVTVNYTL